MHRLAALVAAQVDPIVDRLSTAYTGNPYARGEERVVALIEAERQIVGM